MAKSNLQELRNRLSKAESDAATADGERTAVLKQLEKRFDVKDIKEAKALKKEMVSKLEADEKKLGKAVAKFDEKYDDR